MQKKLNQAITDSEESAAVRQPRPDALVSVRREMALGIARVLILGIALFARLESKAAEFSEHQVKAAFLVNFTRYVDWPAASFSKSNSPVIICILGQDRFGNDLRTLGKSIEGRELVVRKVETAEQCSDCHILFICQSEKARLADVLQKLKGRPVLTVGDTEGFVPAGGMINFKTKAERVRVEINRVTVGKAGLKISSKLLQIADVVGEK